MSMTKDKQFSFQQRWRHLEKKRKDLDFERAAFARDLRGEFETDGKFVTWCVDELSLSETIAKHLLILVETIKLVPDIDHWRRLGGERNLRAVIERVPNKRERVAVIEAAKASFRMPISVINERQKAQAANGNSTESRLPTPLEDARALAAWIEANVEDAPAKVMEIVKRYVTKVPKVRRRAAA